MTMFSSISNFVCVCECVGERGAQDDKTKHQSTACVSTHAGCEAAKAERIDVASMGAGSRSGAGKRRAFRSDQANIL